MMHTLTSSVEICSAADWKTSRCRYQYYSHTKIKAQTSKSEIFTPLGKNVSCTQKLYSYIHKGSLGIYQKHSTTAITII